MSSKLPSQLAPIALFVYNRLSHTIRTVEALKANILAAESELFIFADGAKNEEGRAKVAEVREYIKTISGFKKVTVEEKENNVGLANSIISGVTKIVNQCEKVIAIEDDLVTSKYFLQYMNDGLNFYENEEKVISIHSYIYPVKRNLPETFFIKGADCWGWATWKRGWNLFNPDGKFLFEQLKAKNLTKKFDFDGRYPYTKMLEDQIAGKNNSWAIRWYASAFLADKLTLYPGKSLVVNIGFDGSGTHCGSSEDSRINAYDQKITIKQIPVIQSELARNAIKHYFKPQDFISKIQRLKKKLINKLKKQNKFGV